MALLGMDVDEVERIGHDLINNQHKLLQDVLTAISSHASALPGIWHGNDSQQFLNIWESSHKPALSALMEHVQQLGSTAIKQAGDQREVANS